jgi:hypothetical protein
VTTTGTFASDVSRAEEATFPTRRPAGGTNVYECLIFAGIGFPSRFAGVSSSVFAAATAA